MSVTRGGTAEKGFRAGGSSFGSAGSAGMVMALPHRPVVAILVPEPDGSREVLHADHDPDEPPRLGRVVGAVCHEPSGARPRGRCVAPTCGRTCSRSSGGDRTDGRAGPRDSARSRSSTVGPHSDVITVSWRRCHHMSYAKYCGPRSFSHGPITSNVSWSSSATPPGPSSPFGPPSADMKMPPGPQCTVCGREYPALAASSPASIVCANTGFRGSGLVSRTYVFDDRMPGTRR